MDTVFYTRANRPPEKLFSIDLDGHALSMEALSFDWTAVIAKSEVSGRDQALWGQFRSLNRLGLATVCMVFQTVFWQKNGQG